MTASEHKTHDLATFYKIHENFLKVEIDDFSKNIIKLGDSTLLNLTDDAAKAAFGQRYVMAAFIVGDVAHVRAIPGFDYVEDIAERKKLAEKAAQFFKCSVNDIAFPDNAIWTGVVHDQLIKLVKQREPELVAKAKVAAFSMRKINDKFFWLNRSARNLKTFEPDILACACYMYEEKKDHSQPKFDLLYHLLRSIPQNYFEKLTTTLTEKIYEDDPAPLTHCVMDECTNFSYETKWEEIRKQYNENKEHALEKIHKILMLNLHIYLSGYGAQDKDSRDRTKSILIDGILMAEQYGLVFDVDYIPPEFAGDESALEKAHHCKDHLIMFHLLQSLKKKYLYKLLIKEKSREKIKAVLDKSKSLSGFLRCVAANEIAIKKLDMIDMIFDASSSKEDIIDAVCYCYKENVFKGKFPEARLCAQWLASKEALKTIREAKSVDTELLAIMAEKFLDEKTDYNYQNARGQSLLHIAISLSQGINVVRALLANNANPDIPDDNGKTPIEYALENGSQAIAKLLMEKGAKLPPRFTGDPTRLFGMSKSDDLQKLLNTLVVQFDQEKQRLQQRL